MKKPKIKIVDEFKEFISRGNVIDLAVGVIIGSAFTAIVNAFINDLIMPLIGWAISGINFADFKIVLSPATETAAENAFAYGSFIQSVLVFFITAIVIFLFVKAVNALRRKREKPAPEPDPVPAEPSEEVKLLTEIRDALKK